LLEQLGSYKSKVSLSFLEESHQKLVKPLLESRHEEASYIGYITVTKTKKKSKKGKSDKSILIIGMNRLFCINPVGKVMLKIFF